jgi:zinc protease
MVFKKGARAAPPATDRGGVFVNPLRSHGVRVAAATIALLAPATSAGGQAASASAPRTIPITFEKYTLPNGLTVILSEDHSTPRVAVNVQSHVGSKNEQIGRTGFAHLFEHVMFTGSGHIPFGTHDRLTEGVGGGNNAFTANDITHYYETVPSNYLESALWLESDRMGWLLDKLDLAKYNAQRDIVKNERRQGVDNQPYGRVDEILASATYPKTHPYSWPVIGSMIDLSSASIEDVKSFFRQYYAPNNATLAIVGDFDPVRTKTLITKYFAEIPRGRPITRPRVAPVTLQAEKRLLYEDRVEVPRLYLHWPGVGAREDDTYALDLLSDMLAGSRIARLTKELVYDKQSAAEVRAFNNTNEDVGEFQISITPRPEHTLTSLEAATDSIIARFKREGPTADELKRAKAGLELGFVSGLESNLGKGIRLAMGQSYFNDPSRAFTVDFQKYQSVTAEDVKRVANKYLTSGRVVLSVVPVGKKNLASKPDKSTPVPDATPVPHTEMENN